MSCSPLNGRKFMRHLKNQADPACLLCSSMLKDACGSLVRWGYMSLTKVVGEHLVPFLVLLTSRRICMVLLLCNPIPSKSSLWVRGVILFASPVRVATNGE